MSLLCEKYVSLPPSQIAKLIQKLANTSSVREDYMMPLEPFVKTHNEQLKVWSNLMGPSTFNNSNTCIDALLIRHIYYGCV